MTAVEWLESEFNRWAEGGLFIPPHIITQAKEMEKEQIMNAWNNGFEENRPYVDHSEDYYNETFNKKIR